MRLGIVRQSDNERAVSASFAVILGNKSLTLATSVCAYSVQFCVLSLFFFSGDDNARTHARLRDTVTECRTVLPAAASTSSIVDWRVADSPPPPCVRPINWRRAARSAPRGGELWRSDWFWRRGQLIAWSCLQAAVSVRLLLLRLSVAFLVFRDPFYSVYFGRLQFPNLFQSRLSRRFAPSLIARRKSPWVSCAQRPRYGSEITIAYLTHPFQ